MGVKKIRVFIFKERGDFYRPHAGTYQEYGKLSVIRGEYIYLSGRYEKPGWKDRAFEQRSLCHCQTMSCSDTGVDDQEYE